MPHLRQGSPPRERLSHRCLSPRASWVRQKLAAARGPPQLRRIRNPQSTVWRCSSLCASCSRSACAGPGVSEVRGGALVARVPEVRVVGRRQRCLSAPLTARRVMSRGGGDWACAVFVIGGSSLWCCVFLSRGLLFVTACDRARDKVVITPPHWRNKRGASHTRVIFGCYQRQLPLFCAYDAPKTR